MELNKKQKQVKELIDKIAEAIGESPSFCNAVAMTESSLGLNQKSGTGARGVFQLTSIAMKDLLQEMEKQDDEILDVLCGLAFLHLLKKRWGSFQGIVEHFCAPSDKGFYWNRVMNYMGEFLAAKNQ